MSVLQMRRRPSECEEQAARETVSAILGTPATSCNNAEGVTVHGTVCWLWLTNEAKAPDTHARTYTISTPSHEHIQQSGKKESLPTALMHWAVFGTPGVAGPILTSVSQPGGFQSIKTPLLQHTT